MYIYYLVTFCILFQAKFLKDCGENDICESALEVIADINLHKYGKKHFNS